MKPAYLRWIARTLRDGGWAPLLVFGAHVVASRIVPGYDSFPDLDVPMHFLGGMAIAFFFHVAFRNASRYHVLGPYHRLTHVALVFSFTCTAAVFWEFAEFISDRYFGSHAQGGLVDTMKDMALGIGGGIVFLGISQLLHRSPTPPGGNRPGKKVREVADDPVRD